MADSRTTISSTALIPFRPAPQPVINWQEKIVIDENYIAELLQQINLNFPQQIAGQDSRYFNRRFDYPKEDLKSLDSYRCNLKLSKNYNPLNFDLMSELTSYSQFYEHRRIKDGLTFNSYEIEREDAAASYLDFLREYNLAYIIYLQAINGSAEALSALKELFTTDKMFTRAGVNVVALYEKDRPAFLLGTLAFLSFKILFSPDTQITTVARARALAIVVNKNNFNITNVASAFGRYCGKQYDLATSIGDRAAVYNLIPKIFVTKAEETGRQPHNKIIFKNKTIAEIFKTADGYQPQPENLDRALTQLISHYQPYMIQILHSVLRCVANHSETFKYIFTAIFQLSELDHLQKAKIFGANASYHHPDENIKDETAQSGWVLGLNSFGDYLNERELLQLDVEGLRTRLRQYAYRVELLESQLVEANRERYLATLNAFNDPKGYLGLLLMPADITDDDQFTEMLGRNHRVLARRYHPDHNNGVDNEGMFARVQAAFEELNDRFRRRNYLGSGARAAEQKFKETTDVTMQIANEGEENRTGSPSGP